MLESRENHMPIGMAMPTTWDATGAAVWRLKVHGVEVPGCGSSSTASSGRRNDDASGPSLAHRGASFRR